MSEQTKRADRLDWLFAPLEEIESYRQLRSAVERGGVVCATGLDDSQRLHMLAGLSRDTGRMLLFVTATDQLAQKAADDLLALFHGRVQLLPAREVNFLRVAAASGELAARGACAWLDAGCPEELPYLPVATAGNVGACVPQRIQADESAHDLRFFCRVKQPSERVELRVLADGEILARKRLVAVAPASMLSLDAQVPAGAAPTLEIVEVG